MKKSILLLLTAVLVIGCSSLKVTKLYNKAAGLVYQKQYKDAEDTINDILILDKEYTNAYILRAIIRQINNHIDPAIDDLQTAIKLDKKNYIAHFNLGNLYFVKGDYENALAHYSSSITCNKSFPGAYLNRANTYMKLKRYDEALKDYRYFISVSNNQKEKITKMIKILEESEQ